MCDQQRLRPACTYAQSDQSLCKSLEHSMTVTLPTEQYLKFLSLKGAAQARLSLNSSKFTLLEITCHGSFIFHARLYKDGIMGQ